jgi:hypothetical protein
MVRSYNMPLRLFRQATLLNITIKRRTQFRQAPQSFGEVVSFFRQGRCAHVQMLHDGLALRVFSIRQRVGRWSGGWWRKSNSIAGNCSPRVGFIVTNLGTSSRAVVRFYNKRGTAEQWIREGKQVVAMTRLSCHRFRANEVRLWLSLIAYNITSGTCGGGWCCRRRLPPGR